MRRGEAVAMRLWVPLLLLMLALPALADPAELVLRNGAVYTVNPAQQWAQALAVRDGRIVFVGSNGGASSFIGPKTRVVDLEGRMVAPGFHDVHTHLVEGGVELGRCHLTDCETVEQVRRRIRAYAQAHPKLPWIAGGGWDVALFPGGSPTRQMLDKLVPDRPVCLESSDGHSVWVNSVALARAHLTAATPDPPRGRIERDAAGNPSGTLREAAGDAVESLLPPLALDEALHGLLRAQQIALAFGITSIQDAHAAPQFLAAYREAERRKLLRIRVTAALHTDPSKGPEQVDAMIAERSKPCGPRLRVTAAKIFLDGVIESHTAALLAPYADRPSESGTLSFQPPQLQALVTRLDREGFQVHIHAIGDRAVHEALSAFEQAQAVNGRRDSRHHIAHLQLIDAADIPRFKALDVTANFQSFWMQTDADSDRLVRPALGAERWQRQYPLRSVADSGARVVGGSDWSVTSMNPLDAIEVALTRRPTAPPRGPTFAPAERIDLVRAIEMYTRNAAWINFEETVDGTLEVGKAADLVLLDRHLFKIDPAQIHRVRVLATLIDGRVVSGRLPAPRRESSR